MSVGKVVVFGGGGYIGIPVCELLKKNGYEVIAIDRFFFGKMPTGVDCLKRDIRDLSGLQLKEFSVIDLCGLSNDATSEINTALTREINRDGGSALAALAADQGVKRYIYASSASVYGHGYKQFLTEDDELNPLTAYAKSKVFVEQFVRNLAGSIFEPVILRNATVFGVAPRMRFDLAVNIMTMRAWRDKTIYVMGGGMQYRPFIHVNDLARIICEMVHRPAEQVAGRTFNVGNDALNLTIQQLAGFVKQQVRDTKIHYIPDDTDKRSYHLSFRKLRDIGISCQFGVEYGIKEILSELENGHISGDDPTTHTLAWYRQLIEWEDRLNGLRLDGRML